MLPAMLREGEKINILLVWDWYDHLTYCVLMSNPMTSSFFSHTNRLYVMDASLLIVMQRRLQVRRFAAHFAVTRSQLRTWNESRRRRSD